MPDTKRVILPMHGGEKHQTASFRLRIVRRFSQTLMLALIGQWSFYGIFRCPFLVPYVSCPMGIRPDQANCINCGDCQEVCSRSAIAFGRRK